MTPEGRAAAIAALNEDLKVYVDSLAPGQALDSAIRTGENIVELLENPFVPMPSLKANTYERAYILGVLLARVATADQVKPDDSAGPGLEGLLLIRANRLAQILGGEVVDGPTNGRPE